MDTPEIASSAVAKQPPHPLAATLACGAAMGLADAVPGVSGGTIALILGIYDRFIGALNDCVRFVRAPTDPVRRTALLSALRFLVPLGVALIGGYAVASKLLVGPKGDPGWLRHDDTAPLCYAFFFGLVLFSLRDPWRRIEGVALKHYGLLAVGFVVAFVVSGLPSYEGEPHVAMLFFGGALAISAMLLPGISGSLLLMSLGLYQVVHESAQTVLHGDFEPLPRLAIFLAGILVGASLFIPLLRRVLLTAHDATMAVLTGLMAGALRALWPYKVSYDYTHGTLTNAGIGDRIWLIVLMMLLGGATIFGLTWVERRLAGR